MKKTFVIFIFISLVISQLQAQTKAEKMFQQTMAEYQQNPLKAVTEYLSDDYVLMSGGGYMANKSQVVSIFKNVKSIDVSFKDLKVRQVGNTVIATGLEHDVRHHSDGTPDLTMDYLSTYVYEIKGNKLLGLSGQHTYPAPTNNQAEEESLKNMLRQETIDVYAGKDVSGDFIDSPNTFRGWNTRTGYSVKFGVADIKKENDATFGYRPREMKPINENFIFKYYGNNGVMVTYDQYLYGKEQTPSKEMRMLEKVNGNWKIAGLLALWDYSGNKYEEDMIKKVIQTETDGYHTANMPLMMAQYADKPNNEMQRMDLVALIAKPYAKGQDLAQLQDALKNSLKPTGMTTTNSDYEIRMSSGMAWVTFSQETTKPNSDLRPIKKREMRVLERIDGAWKIVFIGGVDVK